MQVFDEYDNAVTGAYRVTASVRAPTGDGCVCQVGLDALCISHPQRSLQVCTGPSCPASDSGADPVVDVSLGVAAFSGLTCTRASCSPGCTTCAPTNCLPSGQYVMRFTIDTPSCGPSHCIATSQPFDIAPSPFTRLVAGQVAFAVAASPFEGRTSAGFYASPPAGGIAAHLLTRSPPWVVTTDSYGNINALGAGPNANVTVRLEAVGVAGLTAYCAFGSGQICLEGTLNASLSAGKAEFPSLYIRHPSPAYRLSYTVGAVHGFSRLFAAVPPPPRLMGASFAASFTQVKLVFDSDASTSGTVSPCSMLFDAPTSALLGGSAQCSWSSPRVLLAALSNNATLVGSSPMVLSPSLLVRTALSWAPLLLSSGLTSLDRIPSSASANSSVALLSPYASAPPCAPVQLSERLSRLPFDLPVSPDEAIVGALSFTEGGTEYWAVASSCRGLNCLLSGGGQPATQVPIYRLEPIGGVALVQSLPCNRATALDTFLALDVRQSQGGFQSRIFLLVTDADGASLWALQEGTLTLRQTLPAPMATGASILLFAGDLYLAVTHSAGVLVQRWVQGSFRSQPFAGGAIQWVPGSFAERLQTWPAYRASASILYEASGQLFMAVAESALPGGSRRAPVSILRWRKQTCTGMLTGCFEAFMSVPGVGVRAVAAATLEGAGDVLVVANHVEGVEGQELGYQFERDSYVISVDYASKAWSLLQSFSTSGATSLSLFTHCGRAGICGTFLAVANMRGANGLAVASRLYQWGPSCGGTAPRFHAVLDVETVGAAWVRAAQGRVVFAESGRSLVGAYSVDDLVPVPIPEVAARSSFGSCDPLRIDARPSRNAGGRDMQAEWSLESFAPAGGGAPLTGATWGASGGAIAVMLASTRPLVEADTDFPAGDYRVVLRLSNWLGGSQTTRLSFTKLDEASPGASIAGGLRQDTTPDKEVILEGMAVKSICAGASPSPLTFAWSLTPSVPGLSPSQTSSLVIPKRSLSPGVSYAITFTVKQGSSLSSATSLLEVGFSTPIVLLSGGSRLVSLAGEPRALLLDASSSRDPSLSSKTTSAAAASSLLSFSWVCQQQRKLLDAQIGTIAFPCSLIGSVDGPVLTVDSALLLQHTRTFSPGLNLTTVTHGGCSQTVRCDPTATYTLSVTVCSKAASGCVGVPTASSSVVWSTTAASLPDVAILPLESPRISNTKSLRIQGISPAASSLAWLQVLPAEGSILVPDVILTSLSSTTLVLAASAVTGTTSYTLRLLALADPQGVIPPSGQCDACGWAQMIVAQNLPPESGRLVITPASGEALLDVFTLSAEQWSDPPQLGEAGDYPLTYTFGYVDGDGRTKYLSSLSKTTSVATVLPQGFDTSGCAPSNTRCRRLEVSLTVTDALGSEVASAPAYALVSVPSLLSLRVEALLVSLAQSATDGNGRAVLAQASAVADLVNDPSISWAGVASSAAYKTGVRDRAMASVKSAVSTSLAPLTMAGALQAIVAVSAICGVASEVSQATSSAASGLLGTIADEVLARLNQGDDVGQMPVIQAFFQAALDKLLGASGPGGNARRLAPSSQPPPSSLASRLSRVGLGDDERRTLDAAGKGAVELLATIEKGSMLSIAGAAANQVAAVNQGATYKTVTKRIELASMPSLSLAVSTGSPVASSTLAQPLAAPGSTLTSSITLPSSAHNLTATAYDLQLTLLFSSPIPQGRKPFLCIDSKAGYLAASPPVVLPSLEVKSIRTGVVAFPSRPCSILGAPLIANLREHGLGTPITNFSSNNPAVVRLPWDPSLSSEASSLSFDGMTGLRTAVSCLFFDEASGEWSNSGIRFRSISQGGANGTDAYVECETRHLSLFAASEVPAGCNGVPHGSARFDSCGVCGGDNSTCAGCDGEPNSGRTRECSLHGLCQGNRCACEAGYGGVVCHVACSRKDCLHGECIITFDGLSMVANRTCACDSGFRLDQAVLPAGALRTCVPEDLAKDGLQQWAVYVVAVVVPVLLVGCMAGIAIHLVIKRQRQHILLAKGKIDEYRESYLEANTTDGKMEVAVDLCLPIPPSGIPPARRVVEAFMAVPERPPDARDGLDLDGVDLEYLKMDEERVDKLVHQEDHPPPVVGYQEAQVAERGTEAVDRHLERLRAKQGRQAERGDSVKDQMRGRMTVSATSALGPRSSVSASQRNFSSAFMPAGMGNDDGAPDKECEEEGVDEGGEEDEVDV